MSEQPVKTRVFLSYSRRDAPFTHRLAAALTERGYQPDFDQSSFDPANITTGISAEDEWWQRLQEIIAAADVMVFIVTPDSAASKVCDEEIAYARGISKRIVPILRRRIDFAKAPPRLSALNVKIEFLDDGDEAFAVALDQLCTVLDVDVAWHRECARLTKLGLDWHNGGQQTDALMRPADIKSAERVFERQPRNTEPPPVLLADYLEASRSRMEEEMRRIRRITGRAFVKPALQALDAGKPEDALRLAAAGALLADDLGAEVVPELWSPMARAIFDSRTLVVLKGHSASFSPDSRRIVTWSDDDPARVWDAESGAQIACLDAHTRSVYDASFSPNGRRIVTASGDNTARVWDTESRTEIACLNAHTHRVWSASFSPDGRRIVTRSDDKTARVWDTESGAQIACLDAHTQEPWSASFSPDGRWIVTASSDNTARVWDAESGKQIACLDAHTSIVHCASFSPNGRRIVTGSSDHTARVWDAESGKEIVCLNAPWMMSVNSASFSPDGARIVAALGNFLRNKGEARVWDAESGAEIALLEWSYGQGTERFVQPRWLADRDRVC